MTRYLEPTQEAGRAFFTQRIHGSVLMLNLLRFREVADYSDSPELAPAAQISGAEAYRRYMDHTTPFLTESGGEITFYGNGGTFLIGPPDERWDRTLLVRQASIESFLKFATNPAYLAGMGHRTAALEDSRLLPLIEERSGIPADEVTTPTVRERTIQICTKLSVKQALAVAAKILMRGCLTAAFGGLRGVLRNTGTQCELG